MTAGGSSIAVLDDGADLTLDRVDVAAGAGKDGAVGAGQNQVTTPMTANGQPGTDDPMCNIAGAIGGGHRREEHVRHDRHQRRRRR